MKPQNFNTSKPSKIVLFVCILAGALLGILSVPSNADVFHKTELVKVLDGDTLHIRVEVWPSVIIDTKLRVMGIDTPESRTKCQAEKVLAAKAKVFTQEMTANGFSIGFGENGKYAGRTLGTVHIPIKVIPAKYTSQKSVREYVEKGLEPSLGDALIEAGLAVPYFGGKKKDWAAELCPQAPHSGTGVVKSLITLDPLELE